MQTPCILNSVHTYLKSGGKGRDVLGMSREIYCLAAPYIIGLSVDVQGHTLNRIGHKGPRAQSNPSHTLLLLWLKSEPSPIAMELPFLKIVMNTVAFL